MNLVDMLGPIESATPDIIPMHNALLWGGDDVLAQTVSSYLEETSWNVIKIQNDGNIERLVAELKRVRPTIVILCQYQDDHNAGLPLRLLQEQLCLKVLTLGMDSNLMHVYCKQDIVLQGATDLLSIIELGQSSNCKLRGEVGPKKQNP